MQAPLKKGSVLCPVDWAVIIMGNEFITLKEQPY